MEIVKIDSLRDIHKAGELIVRLLGGRRVVAFRGDMGAGKTTLIKEIARQMGVNEEVSSPTFSLVNQYIAGDGSVINHFDFYRIERLEEAFDMGYEEYFYSGELCFVEWPERIDSLLPHDVMTVHIEIVDHNRRIISVL